MIAIVAVLLSPQNDLLLLVCKGLDRDSWEWWLKGCFIFDPAAWVVAGLLAIGAAKVLSWLNGAR